MRFDGLVLSLMWRELRGSLAGMRKRDAAWIVLGGGGLLAYGLAINVAWLVRNADWVRDAHGAWLGALALVAASGLLDGMLLARPAQKRAHARFLAALPISDDRRRAMAASAAFAIGVAPAMLSAALMLAACLAVAKPAAALWVVGTALLSFGALAAGVALRLRRPYVAPEERLALPGSAAGITLPVAPLDRSRPRWVGSWAWNLPAGRLTLSGRGVVLALALLAAGLLATVASLARASAAPAVIAGLVGGLILFMATARYHPLVSPVLRTAPLRFGRAWLRIAKLPLALSVAFFAVLAGPAVAAEPGAWTLPLSGGLGLLILNSIYAVFAAFFATAPVFAAIAFLLALALTAYETLEYGRSVLLGLAALVVFVFIRTRRRYLHG
ncbi:MAG: hypothetical protein KIS96_05475 [Bauldia sp.]|nr:hypothetical protein [Bauldia sp.]